MNPDDPHRHRLTISQLVGLAIMIPGMLWFAWESASPGDENRFLPLACGIGGLLLLAFTGPPAEEEERGRASPMDYADDDINGAVELRDAIGWTCEICGRDNFQDALRVPEALHDEHDRAVLREICDISDETPLDEGDRDRIDMKAAFQVFQVPRHVRCRYCDSRFAAVRDPRRDAPEEEYGS